jgi:hypothetical protein
MQKSNERFLLRPIITTSLGVICIIITLYLLFFTDYNRLGRYAPAVFLSVGLIWPISNVLKEPLRSDEKRSICLLAIIGFVIAIIYGIVLKGSEHRDFLEDFFDSLTTNKAYYIYLSSFVVISIISQLSRKTAIVTTSFLFGLMLPFLFVGFVIVIIWIILLLYVVSIFRESFAGSIEKFKSIYNSHKKIKSYSIDDTVNKTEINDIDTF